MSDKVQVSTRDGVTTVTLARPEKKNALTGDMYQVMTTALARASEDEGVRVVLLQPEGGDFCVGSDIAEFAAANAGGPRPRHAQDFIRALSRFEKPLVAAAPGLAVGIGLTMLLHCDLVFLAEDSRLTAPFGLLGLTPEAGSSLLLPAAIGHARAFALFALGEPLSGQEAAALGLATRALPAAEVKGEALASAQKLAARSPAAMRATKALMRRSQAVADQIERELVEFEERLKSPEAAAAFKAFAERSKAG